MKLPDDRVNAQTRERHGLQRIVVRGLAKARCELPWIQPHSDSYLGLSSLLLELTGAGEV